jgi:hypothetical protein
LEELDACASNFDDVEVCMIRRRSCIYSQSSVE